jgi:hypothetical protein
MQQVGTNEHRQVAQAFQDITEQIVLPSNSDRASERMGKAIRNKSERSRPTSITHEPNVPSNWPDGHVDVALTGDGAEECIGVTVDGVRHFLHSTTAQELSLWEDVNAVRGSDLVAALKAAAVYAVSCAASSVWTAALSPRMRPASDRTGRRPRRSRTQVRQPGTAPAPPAPRSSRTPRRVGSAGAPPRSTHRRQPPRSSPPPAPRPPCMPSALPRMRPPALRRPRGGYE